MMQGAPPDNATPDLPEDAAILVVSCDAYADVWPVFFTLFFRYWPDCTLPVFLGANDREYDDKRVTTICVGEDRSWAESTRAMLEALDATYVLIILDDFLIWEAVDDALVTALLADMRHIGARHIRFRPKYHSDRLIPGHPIIAELSPGTPYRVSLEIGLWRRETLLSLLEDGESAWQMEIDGSRRSDGLTGFYCSTEQVFSRTNGLGRGKWIRYNLPLLKRERIALPAGHPVMSVPEYMVAWTMIRFWRLRVARALRTALAPAWRSGRRLRLRR